MFKTSQMWGKLKYLINYNGELNMKPNPKKPKRKINKQSNIFMEKVINGTYNFFTSPWDK
tara:strand:+ start:172 stop:351 length:180 start_codon:yes stop_codon:yes gene_type:complete